MSPNSLVSAISNGFDGLPFTREMAVWSYPFQGIGDQFESRGQTGTSLAAQGVAEAGGLCAGTTEGDAAGPGTGLRKQLLRYLLTDIRVETDRLTLRGSVPKLENAVAEMKMGTAVTVPTIMTTWHPRHESNV